MITWFKLRQKEKEMHFACFTRQAQTERRILQNVSLYLHCFIYSFIFHSISMKFSFLKYFAGRATQST